MFIPSGGLRQLSSSFSCLFLHLTFTTLSLYLCSLVDYLLSLSVSLPLSLSCYLYISTLVLYFLFLRFFVC